MYQINMLDMLHALNLWLLYVKYILIKKKRLRLKYGTENYNLQVFKSRLELYSFVYRIGITFFF